MKIWLITDTHFGHDKMVEWCGRPQGFSDKILKNLFSSPMGRKDLLIHLGDFCIGKDEYWHTEFDLHMNPRINRVLVRGNHDKKSDNWYYEHGWNGVCEELLINFEGKRILFSHIPQKDDGRFDLNIHGHFHNSLHRLLEAKWVTDTEEERNREELKVLTPKHRLLAVEYANYQPIQLKTFLSAKHPKQ